MMVAMASILAYTISTRVRVQDFNDDNPSDEDDPVTPVNPPTQPPAEPPKILPVASGTFTTLTLSYSVTKFVNRVGQICYSFDSSLSTPNVNINPYTGTEDPVFQWAQLKPKRAQVGVDTILVKYHLELTVRANFASTQYLYGTSPTFEAKWTSYTYQYQFNWAFDKFGTLSAQHTFSGTGNIYYWEHGSYTLYCYVFYEMYKGGTELINSGSYMAKSVTFTV